MKLHAVRKMTAKVMAFLLAGTMALGAGMMGGGTVYAAGNPPVIDAEATGSLTIERSNGKEGDESALLDGAVFTAYKVMSLTKGTDGNISWNAAEAFRAALGDVTPETLGDKSAEEQQALANALAAVENKGTGTASAQVTEGTDEGKYKISGMELGLYLVMETTAPDGYMASRPFLVSIPMADNYDNNENGATDWTYNVAVKAKAEEIDLTKELAEEDGNDAVTGLGDFVKYEINTMIPTYGPEYFEGDATVIFRITDIMSDGLKIQNDNENSHPVTVTVKNAGAAQGSEVEAGDGNANYTLTAEPAEGVSADLTIDFTTEFIRNHPGAEVKVTYYAQVTEKAVMGTAGNVNTAKLTYSNKPGTDGAGNPYTEEKEDDETVYTFGIQVVKFNTENGTREVLPGAKFVLYRENTDGVLSEPVEVKYEDGTTADTLTSGTDGTLSFPRLDEGTYYLKETESPAGYTLLANPIRVEIAAEKDANGKATGAFSLKVNGEDVTAVTDTADAANKFITTLSREEKDGSITSTGIANVAVENHRGFSLPSTGGMGVTLFLLVGAAGIIGLSIVMTRKPKKQK